MPSLQKISESIPAASVDVRKYFSLATAPDPVSYSTFKRYVYASGAIAGSLITAFATGFLSMPNRVIMAPFIHFERPLIDDLENRAGMVYSSLYFAAALTAYLFKTIIWGTANDLIIDPYKMKPESRASYLKSTTDLDFLIGHKDFPPYEIEDLKLFAHTDRLNIDSIPDLSVLYAIVNSRSDLVLIFSQDESSAYLAQRSTPWVKERIMADTLVFHEMPALPEPIIAPVIEPMVPDEEIEAPPGLTYKFEDPAATPPSYSSYFLGPIKSVVGKLFGEYHIFKDMKYRHPLAHFYKLITRGKGLELYNRVDKTKTDPELRRKCVRLYEIITQPENYAVRDQHNALIDALCDARRSLKPDSDPAFGQWIRLLSYERYTGVSLAGYYKSLVVSSFGEIPELNLENFGTVLDDLNHQAEHLSGSQGIPKAPRAKQQLLGHVGIKDFGEGPNIPAKYGQLKIDGQTINIIRHATPIDQNSAIGRTEIKPDYTAFYEKAAENGENILHTILESLLPKSHARGDESVRGKTRLALDEHPNVFTLALSFDNDFVKAKNYAAKPIADLKTEFADLMFGENTGYAVPAKLNFNREQFNQIMDKVLNEFFPGKERLETKEEFQAFVVLTYAEMILSLCKSLNISYLEALCKDDKDRGGVMKAVIVLLHLYRAGKFGKGQEKQLAKALEDLMVNIVAIPLTITKDAMIESRCAYIKNVLNVLRETVARAPVPVDAYRGNFNVQSDPYQRVVPMGSTCRTKKEYLDFLTQVKTNKITLTSENPESVLSLFNNEQLGFVLTPVNQHLYKIRDMNSGLEIAAVRLTDKVTIDP